MIEEITSFNFNTTPRIVYGPNVAKDAGSYAKLMGNRILLVTDKGLSDFYYNGNKIFDEVFLKWFLDQYNYDLILEI